MAATIIVPTEKLQEFIDDANSVDIDLSSFRFETRQSTFEWEAGSGPDDTEYQFDVTVRGEFEFVSEDFVDANDHAQLQAEYNKLELERDELLENIVKLQARIEEQATTIIQMGTQLLAKRPWWKFW